MPVDAYIAKDSQGVVRAALQVDGYDDPVRLNAAVDAMTAGAKVSLERMRIAGGVVVEAVQLPFNTWGDAVEAVFGKPWPVEQPPARVAGNVALKAAAPVLPTATLFGGNIPRMRGH